jgi:hypothetical protein
MRPRGAMEGLHNPKVAGLNSAIAANFRWQAF